MSSKKQQVVFMVGKSRGAKDGDRRTVSPERAERLVSAGRARYPKAKAAESEK